MTAKFDPRAQLEKHGWTTGAGLGRDEDGIKEALKVKLKFDQAGVGHDAAEQFTFHWYDHVFNKAASSLKVADNEDAVVVTSKGDFNISNKKSSQISTTKPLVYGTFVKSKTLNDGGEDKQAARDSGQSSSDSSDESDTGADTGTAWRLTDEDLMKICGGRTAHKGARHGLGLGGKLQRIAQQEQQFRGSGLSEPAHSSGPPSPTPDHPPNSQHLGAKEGEGRSKNKRKKNKKRSHADVTPDTEEAHLCDDHVNDEACDNDKKEKRKRKKEKRKSKRGICEESLNECSSHDNDNNSDIVCITKKKKSKRKGAEVEETSVGGSCSIEVGVSQGGSKEGRDKGKKKKQSGTTEERQGDHVTDVSEHPKKKKRRKSAPKE